LFLRVQHRAARGSRAGKGRREHRLAQRRHPVAATAAVTIAEGYDGGGGAVGRVGKSVAPGCLGSVELALLQHVAAVVGSSGRNEMEKKMKRRERKDDDDNQPQRVAATHTSNPIPMLPGTIFSIPDDAEVN
jgi:hypothetical protein